MQRKPLVLWTLVVAAGLGLATVAGLVLERAGVSNAPSTATQIAPAGRATAGLVEGAMPYGAPTASSGESVAGSAAADQSSKVDRLVVLSASVSLRVRDIQAAIGSVRAAAAAVGGTVSDLEIDSGNDGTPQPLQSENPAASAPAPSSGTVTIRVPAAKLAGVEARIVKIGDVTAQTSSESDVTQQHIDLSARLKNLQAEESRLRTLFNRAGGVSAMLEVERELTRVRGDIESMQAQLSYLEQQAALATLTISLTQPGPLVRPSEATWGFADAFTHGVQSAASLLRALITGGVALSPLALLALLGWLAWWWRRSRRQRRTATTTADS